MKSLGCAMWPRGLFLLTNLATILNTLTGKNGSGINQSGSPGETTCPVFKETIMEHHVILRRKGCELYVS